MKIKSWFIFTMGICLLSACSAQNSPPTEPVDQAGAAKLENRFSDGVVGAHNPALLDELLGDDFVSHHFPMPGNNDKAAFTEGMKALFAAFPDIEITRLQQMESGDKVFTYAFWEGTHQGTFMGIPATGKKAHVEYMDIWRVKDGKVRENWVVMDIAGLLIQLGVMPPPGAGN